MTTITARREHEVVHRRTPRSMARFAAFAAVCAAALAFLGLHARLEASHWSGWPSSIFRGAFVADVCRYVALAGGAAFLVLVGRRRSFFMPTLAFSFLPWIVGWSDERCTEPSRMLAAVGGGWSERLNVQCPGTTSADLVPVLVDLALCLIPAIALVLSGVFRRSGEEVAPPSFERRVARLGSLAFVSFIVWSIAWVLATTGYGGLPMRRFAPDLVPLLLFGALVGTWRLKSSWILVAFPILLATDWPDRLAAMGVWPSPFEMKQTLPYLVTPAIGAMWQPLASLMERGAGRPRVTFVALNLLNVADALLTHVAVRSGEVGEANPVVRLIGLPTKIMLVAALSVALMRLRPRAVPFLVLAFAAVLTWHSAGLAASVS